MDSLSNTSNRSKIDGGMVAKTFHAFIFARADLVDVNNQGGFGINGVQKHGAVAT